jgi:NAD(P)H-quinone oxidoreductase subunit 5
MGCLFAYYLSKHKWKIANISATAAFIYTAIVSISALLNYINDETYRPDVIGHILAMMIVILGWVIIRFSFRYLQGESGQHRYVVALLFTLSTVAFIVVTQHLGILVIAWIGSSIGLHYLLTFFRDRPAAQIAAHKKFLVSRMAEVCLVMALILVYSEVGSLTFSAISSHVQALTNITSGLYFATIFIVFAAILKSAQLPLHGWLIQVMEAPTPVSALLHAGIVNIGGIVLIRLAQLINAVPMAQVLLIVVGSLTAVIAGLVMLTRISIKVRLAWSTCAQMGFMLMECGLGLYDLALLHLLAHSLYKAYSFLTAGETVKIVRQNDLASKESSSSAYKLLTHEFIAMPIALIMSLTSLYVWQWFIPDFKIASTMLLIISLGLAPLLWSTQRNFGINVIYGVLRIVILIQLYFVWHIAFSAILPSPSSTSILLNSWVILLFLVLYFLQVWLTVFPHGRLSTSLFPWAYAGFYLDESFTRFTFKIWPVKMSNHSTVKRKSHSALQGENV